jgi:hypothetical protein
MTLARREADELAMHLFEVKYPQFFERVLVAGRGGKGSA